MTNENYYSARKLGIKAAREAAERDASPYVPALEEEIRGVSIVGESSLGVREIPLSRIIGTYSTARRVSFAPNFMPILDGESEFADKWELLFRAHMNEGINMPIKVYEYLHHFYVIEGNKRVSVMKYVDAGLISGNITRLVPKRNDSVEVRVYYEYLRFFEYCPTLSLIFSHPGDYDEFITFTKKDPRHVWTESEMQDLESFYYRFHTAFKSLGGKELHEITTGDALLSYLHFYGYPESVDKLPAEITAELRKIWDEIVLLTSAEPVEMVMDPDEVPEQGMLEKLLTGMNKKDMKAAFIYDHSPMKSAWAYGQDLGRMHLEEVFQGRLETKVCDNVDEKSIDGTLEALIEDGTDLIFVTTSIYTDACVRAAALHPTVKILICALDLPHRYVRTYYPRIYEAKYLSGVLAGIMTEETEIGYVADYPIHSSIAAANAFALGVQAVNPSAKIHIQWTQENNSDPAAYFKAHGIHMISDTALRAPMDDHREFGLYRLTENGRENLAMLAVNWGVLFQRLIETIQNGRWENEQKISGGKALNYWFGFSNEVLEFFYSHTVPARTKALVEHLRNDLETGAFRPFSGIIRSQEGSVTEAESDYLTPMEIAGMNWLNENIIGRIPPVSDLSETAQKLMALQTEIENAKEA